MRLIQTATEPAPPSPKAMPRRLLVEGWRDSNLLKIEIWRAAHGRSVRFPDDPFIVAIAAPAPDALPEDTLRPRLDLDNPDAVAAWLVDNGDRFEYDPQAYV